jgi:hypothetical protein
MDWNDLRRRWHEVPAAPVPETLADELEARDRALRAALKRRDLVETGAALVIAPVFVALAVKLFRDEAWAAFAFCALIVAWIAFVPWRLWRARRALPVPRADLPSLAYLGAEREAMLAQARMLEQAWLWYFAPCAVGVAGLAFSVAGLTTKSVAYVAIVAAFCAVMSFANRHAARVAFREHAAAISRQIEQTSEDEPR